MRGTHGRRLVLLALLVSSLLVACDPQSPDRTFVIDVRRIEAPATLPADDAFEIRLYGIIGPTLCEAFDHYQTRRTAHSIEITAIGTGLPDRACAQAISELNGEPPVVVAPPFAGPFRVTVHRPDGTTLEIEIPPAP